MMTKELIKILLKSNLTKLFEFLNIQASLNKKKTTVQRPNLLIENNSQLLLCVRQIL